MGEIGGNTWGVDNIVEGELIDERAVLQEEGQRLNRSASAIDLSPWLFSVVIPVQFHQRHRRQLQEHQ